MYNIRREWTIREVELNPSILTSRKGLLRWFAISMGLINQGDRREGVIVLLDALFTYWFSRGKNPTFEELKYFVSRRYLERGEKPPSDEALRHHLRKMTRMGFIDRIGGRYKLNNDPLRPDDPISSINMMFKKIENVKEQLMVGFTHLKNLYT